MISGGRPLDYFLWKIRDRLPVTSRPVLKVKEFFRNYFKKCPCHKNYGVTMTREAL
jgi:hypothetical protein